MSIMVRYSCGFVSTTSTYRSMPFVDVLKMYFSTGKWAVDFAYYYIWYTFDAFRRIFQVCYIRLYYDGTLGDASIINGGLFVLGI